MSFTDPMFGAPSLLTMAHGIVLGGAALMALAAALFHVYAFGADTEPEAAHTRRTRAFARLVAFAAVTLWATVIAGTYVVFPPYRATPLEAASDLSGYPRAFILASSENAWLHSFGMEIKEHVPWMVAMIATSVAFVAGRYGARVLADRRLRTMTAALLTICLVLASAAALLGVLANKFAPLE